MSRFRASTPIRREPSEALGEARQPPAVGLPRPPSRVGRSSREPGSSSSMIRLPHDRVSRRDEVIRVAKDRAQHGPGRRRARDAKPGSPWIWECARLTGTWCPRVPELSGLLAGSEHGDVYARRPQHGAGQRHPPDHPRGDMAEELRRRHAAGVMLGHAEGSGARAHHAHRRPQAHLAAPGRRGTGGRGLPRAAVISRCPPCARPRSEKASPSSRGSSPRRVIRPAWTRGSGPARRGAIRWSPAPPGPAVQEPTRLSSPAAFGESPSHPPATRRRRAKSLAPRLRRMVGATRLNPPSAAREARSHRRNDNRERGCRGGGIP